MFKSLFFSAKGQRRWIPCIDRVHNYVSPQKHLSIMAHLADLLKRVFLRCSTYTASGVMCVIAIRKLIWYVASPCVKYYIASIIMIHSFAYFVLDIHHVQV